MSECDYCQGGKTICDKNKNYLGIELHSATQCLVAYGIDKCGWDVSVCTKVNYCPMCGRKLGD